MAEAKNSVTQDQFCCPVCLETLKDPVAIPCGHSFCMVCINNCWDQEDDKGTYSCPQCRETFTPRPAVSKNIILAEVVENLRKRKSQVPLPTGGEDVECDSCTGRKYEAVKSCLVCLASYCETHLQPHYESPAFKKHKLVKASRRLQEQICSQHDKLLEVYCRTDQQCICMLCTMDDHKGHDTISAAAERTEKQKQLLKIQKKIQKKIQNREKKLNELINAVESHKFSAQTAVENIERICTELINSFNRRCSEVKELIRDREKVVVSQAENVMTRLEREIVDLKKKDAELEKLSHTEDPIHFLQSFQSLSTPAGSAESPIITISPFLSFDDVTESVSQLRKKVEEFWKEQFEKIPDEVKEIQILSPQTREDFLQYFCRFTLDLNTVNEDLSLSEENKVATWSGKFQSYPDHPDRFDCYPQVLCRESVSGRCYWEVEWSGNYGVYIAVSYKSISRKGEGYECLFGRNDQSWILHCSSSRFSFWHNSKGTEIPIMPSSSRIGVYVDYRAGTLSFYSVSDTMKLLHRVQTTFTQPLYPGFCLYSGSKVKLINTVYKQYLKRIQQYAVDVTLDPDTTNSKLILSDDGKQVKHGDKRQNLPDSQERFISCPCVLGKQGFSSGRFYYEVQVCGKTDWDLGVTRGSINRTGKVIFSPTFGYWIVWLRNKTEYEACDSPPVLLTLKQAPQKVGVFVDYEEGLVSFYDVDASSHIYSFTDQSFKGGLYPYFCPSVNYRVLLVI
ncbi:tripartite motif-containing protein 16-like [Trichomycterus rosablanca]|uniref:tripartite motif-containing protein 16-like n=1 Tax=Trichomycterus rosablanca TaxID=2290929 RepID=UPI002F35AE88